VSKGASFTRCYDRIWRLTYCWRRGSGCVAIRELPAIDGETLTMIEQQGVGGFLVELQDILRSGGIVRNRYGGRYIRKRTTAGRWIPNGTGSRGADGNEIVLEPIFRGGLSTVQLRFSSVAVPRALESHPPCRRTRSLSVVDAESRILRRHRSELLMALVGRRISDRRVPSCCGSDAAGSWKTARCETANGGALRKEA